MSILLKMSGVACRASHFIELPNIFLFFYILFFVSLLSAAKHFAPADVCDSSCLLYKLCLLFCYFVRPGLTPSQCTVDALFYDFTAEVIFTDKVSTVRCVAAQLCLLKEYRPHIVRTLVYATHTRNLSLYGFPTILPWTDTYYVTYCN